MSVEICAIIAFLCAVLVGCSMVLRKEKIVEDWRSRFIRKAKRRKTCAEAFMIKKEEGQGGECAVTYEYQVGKRKYHKKVTFNSDKQYKSKIIVYYNAKSPAQGICEEVKENYSIGLNIFGWSLLTLILVFFILECVFDRNNIFGESMDMVSSELEVLITNPQILLVAAVAIAIYILEFHWISKRTEAKNRKKEEAIAAGRVVLGTRIKSWYELRRHNHRRVHHAHRRVYHAVYVYEVNGKKYRRGAYSYSAELPSLVYFYYIKTPKKVLCDYDNVDMVVQLMVPVLFILPIAVAWVFMKVFGIDLGMLN